LAQLSQLGSSVSHTSRKPINTKETNKCGQTKRCSPGRTALDSSSGLTCKAFVSAQHERCPEHRRARCQGAGCCAGTGEPEPSRLAVNGSRAVSVRVPQPRGRAAVKGGGQAPEQHRRGRPGPGRA